jgi:hypothetical protein
LEQAGTNRDVLLFLEYPPNVKKHKPLPTAFTEHQPGQKILPAVLPYTFGSKYLIFTYECPAFQSGYTTQAIYKTILADGN